MPNPYILNAITAIWSKEGGHGRRILDLSCGPGDTSRMLSANGFKVVATDYPSPPFMGDAIGRVGGVDLNERLPFRDRAFDAINLIEVIEHIEHQPQLIREMARVLKDRGVVVISTPNVLNVFSRLRFLFTGFLRGRVRPLHYTFKPGQAHNIYLIHFYELYYLLFHSDFEIEALRTTRVKFAPLFFSVFIYPFMWLFSLFSIIWPEKDPVQRAINWRILRYIFSPPLLFSDNIVVKARLRDKSREFHQLLLDSDNAQRTKVYRQLYDRRYERRDFQSRMPSPRRRQRIQTYKGLVGRDRGAILELGCGIGDLTYALAGHGRPVIGCDIALTALQAAIKRSVLWKSETGAAQTLGFAQMNATELAFPDASFDCVVSTSMIEHLHPADIQPHLREVERVLKPRGLYIVWCPNVLGHHGDRDVHLSMFSHRELMNEMKCAGFRQFQSLLFNRLPFYVNATWKVVLEEFLHRWNIRILWSHLGVRNILLLALK